MDNALLQAVANRGRPPDAFIMEMVTALQGLPLDVFAPNNRFDVYDTVHDELGPYVDLEHRRACMAEVLRVLAGFESSWQWNCGVDHNNPASVRPETQEAGAWQVSCDSRWFGPDLKTLAPADGVEFQRVMKADHRLATEYIARLLRWTTRHNGPVARLEINPWLRRNAVATFQFLLTTPDILDAH